ncbi:hypothetical protein OH77DRAFT_1414297, partial [Trametes cingulata]
MLGLDTERKGLFGQTAAYYGTVEEQGRKTLHLHLLVWIEGCPSPQEIRERLLGDESFRTRFLSWLESCHTGDFFSERGDVLQHKWEEPGPERLVNGRVKKGKPVLLIRDAATTLPRRPPRDMADTEIQQWYASHRLDVDQVIFCSNRHDPEHGHGCMRGEPPDEYCRARFPRELYADTLVDQSSGAVRFKKQDAWINTYHPLLSSALRCNTDVTCLLSGTQVRAIIAYVTDYVTKSSLTTHTFFQTIRTV